MLLFTSCKYLERSCENSANSVNNFKNLLDDCAERGVYGHHQVSSRPRSTSRTTAESLDSFTGSDVVHEVRVTPSPQDSCPSPNPQTFSSSPVESECS